ncbi:unnamed protein product [Hyaloperonospora brassicae]|uniref:START domain-containing protein n=1 Tax=Hyaloperonospora brassicae TaxID=162125 RepID=A0AAV0UG34_HYABA|nr:unnamed protein product [Hyaloperonospora brassicae]
MTFPLPLDYFPPLRLSAREAQSFRQWGDALLEETIDAFHCEQQQQQQQQQTDPRDSRDRTWKPIKHRHDLTVERLRKVASDRDYKYRLTGRLDGTLDEVVMGRYADNTPDFRRLSGVYRPDVVDCAVLGVLDTRSPSNPFFLSCFKWMTVASPSKGLVKKRDVCWYEQVGLTRDRRGKEMGYTLTESVELPTCPRFAECVRAKLSVCYLYQRHPTGGVRVFMRGRNDAGGHVAEWVTDLKSADLWLRIEQAVPVAHAVIATALVKAARHVVPGPRAASAAAHGQCGVCLAKASRVLSALKTCAVCHKRTCARCVAKVRVLNYYDFRVPHYTPFCKQCTYLIHQFDLRAQQSDPARATSASVTGHDGLRRSADGTAAFPAKDGSDEGRARATTDGGVYRSTAASVTSNDSCSSSSSGLFSQAILGVDYDVRTDDSAYSQRRVPMHPGHPEYHNCVKASSSSLPAVPVAMGSSNGGVYAHETSYNTGAYGAQRRHSHEPPRTTVDRYYAGRESETPLVWPDDGDSQGSSSDFGADARYRSALGSSTDALITPMLKMNLIAEQSPAAAAAAARSSRPEDGPFTPEQLYGR